MKLLNLAIAFALLAVAGLIIMFSGYGAEGIGLILLGELGAWACVHADEQQQQKKFIQRRILG